MSYDDSPELSVVVPVLNEEAELHRFLEELARQRDTRFELILSDGESGDGTVAAAKSLAGQLPFPLLVVDGGKGRAAQMNVGAGLARAQLLLFLHIDSRFPDPLAFRKGIDALTPTLSGATPLAGHFILEFDFPELPPLPYRFYGAKASLDRRGCTHGDQGMLIPASFFGEVGPFDPSLPIMEDTFLAERIREVGGWLLLPARIRTSPRRFLAEGLLARQTLNAILMDLAHTGHLDLMASLKECYLSQDATHRLELFPFLKVLKERIAALPRDRRGVLWRETGRYVRSNAWQVPFWLDVLIGKGGAGKGGPFLALHDRWLGRLIDNGLADRAASLLVWIWFRCALLLGRR
ncbi:TIGR04283 family arsenosugar biosynthesis glycosyltransferase [Geomonas sp.]|uniref:TIGR04283 family arsenosugar biosynthesis glycosyltransferase n=1 Tax=Geomonas sp. TaxID=2651584 RepID=UPI002B4592E9|nr:TIGR04283 family arsenosugar biosynthesis glycosyltransferase [Geomonas sp.]HJV34240.1 TIGR04283 family arsenosugar biosynthesis glycosyltransferase [Geomonas sp.]